MIAKTPEVPYYAVIFSSIRTKEDHGYAETSEQMIELAKNQAGFLGVEYAREGLGITVSYWKDLESIKKWKKHADHARARHMGREQWYKEFKVRIALVERDYEFEMKENL